MKIHAPNSPTTSTTRVRLSVRHTYVHAALQADAVQRDDGVDEKHFPTLRHNTSLENPRPRAGAIVLVTVQGHPVLDGDRTLRCPPVNDRLHGGGRRRTGGLVGEKGARDYLGRRPTAWRGDAHDEFCRRIVLALDLLGGGAGWGAMGSKQTVMVL